jgi:hypothetical protein
MMVRCDGAVERSEKITMPALHLQRAAQFLFQRRERVQRNSFQHARVKFRLPEKRSARRRRGISLRRELIDRFVGAGEH